jgi:putative ABC transport system permease protein
VRRELQAVDPRLPLIDITTMRARIALELSPLRITANAMLLFGAIALLLAAAGVYAVMSYIVTQRTHEIGVRVALGARRGAVLRLFLSQALGLTAIGIVIGLLGSAGIGAVITSSMYGARPADPLTFAAVTTLLVVVALAACGVPVQRATRVDPMVALRHD